MRVIGNEDHHFSTSTGWVLRQDHDPDAAGSSFGEALRMSRRNGNTTGIAYASLGLACLAADASDWHQAAVLHGVAQAFLDQTRQPWEDVEARYRRDSLDQVHAHLGQDQFNRAYASGMALSFDEALDLASARPSRLIIPRDISARSGAPSAPPRRLPACPGSQDEELS